MSALRPPVQGPGRARRIPVAFALLGTLGLLAAGGAVLGILQAPASAAPSVHDATFAVRRAAARTLHADRVVGTYCYARQCEGSRPFLYHFSYTAPDTTDMFATHGQRVVGGSRCSGPCARRVGASVLQPVLALSAFPRFSVHGGFYESSKELGSVFKRSIESEVGGVSRLGGALFLVINTVGYVKGDVTARVEVSSGYVVGVDLKMVVDVQPPEYRGDHRFTIPVRFTQVGSWREG